MQANLITAFEFAKPLAFSSSSIRTQALNEAAIFVGAYLLSPTVDSTVIRLGMKVVNPKVAKDKQFLLQPPAEPAWPIVIRQPEPETSYVNPADPKLKGRKLQRLWEDAAYRKKPIRAANLADAKALRTLIGTLNNEIYSESGVRNYQYIQFDVSGVGDPSVPHEFVRDLNPMFRIFVFRLVPITESTPEPEVRGSQPVNDESKSQPFPEVTVSLGFPQELAHQLKHRYGASSIKATMLNYLSGNWDSLKRPFDPLFAVYSEVQQYLYDETFITSVYAPAETFGKLLWSIGDFPLAMNSRVKPTSRSKPEMIWEFDRRQLFGGDNYDAARFLFLSGWCWTRMHMGKVDLYDSVTVNDQIAIATMAFIQLVGLRGLGPAITAIESLDVGDKNGLGHFIASQLKEKVVKPLGLGLMKDPGAPVRLAQRAQLNLEFERVKKAFREGWDEGKARYGNKLFEDEDGNLRPGLWIPRPVLQELTPAIEMVHEDKPPFLIQDVSADFDPSLGISREELAEKLESVIHNKGSISVKDLKAAEELIRLTRKTIPNLRVASFDGQQENHAFQFSKLPPQEKDATRYRLVRDPSIHSNWITYLVFEPIPKEAAPLGASAKAKMVFSEEALRLFHRGHGSESIEPEMVLAEIGWDNLRFTFTRVFRIFWEVLLFFDRKNPSAKAVQEVATHINSLTWWIVDPHLIASETRAEAVPGTYKADITWIFDHDQFFSGFNFDAMRLLMLEEWRWLIHLTNTKSNWSQKVTTADQVTVSYETFLDAVLFFGFDNALTAYRSLDLGHTDGIGHFIADRFLELFPDLRTVDRFAQHRTILSQELYARQIFVDAVAEVAQRYHSTVSYRSKGKIRQGMLVPKLLRTAM